MIAAIVLAGTPVVVFCVRTAVAGWLVEPTPYPTPSPPTRDIELIEDAAAWAPREARYPFFIAHVLRQRLHAGWLEPEAPRLGQRAAEAVARATELGNHNPYFHRLAAAIALDRARHPESTSAERAELVRKGVASSRAALSINSESPLLLHLIGTDLLASWAWLGDEGRRLALDSLRHAAHRDPDLMGSALSSVWLAVAPEERFAALDAVIPDTSPGHARAARELETLLGGHISLPAVTEARRFLSDRYFRAATTNGLQLSLLQAWIEAHRRFLPEHTADLVAQSETLVAEQPDAAAAWVALARVRALSGDNAGAVEAVTEALAVVQDPSDPIAVAARRERAAVHIAGGAPHLAVADLEIAADGQPDSATLRIELAEALEADGRETDALAAYEAAVLLTPDAMPPRRELARAYARRFRYRDAIAQWRYVLARDPEGVRPNLELARLYRDMNVPEQAIEFYTRVLELNPDVTAARTELNALLQERR